jgi:Uma2 family endonuclease
LSDSGRGPHIMGMPQPIGDWTVAQVLALPDDGNRYEVVDGELLVTPAPSLLHQRAVRALNDRLGPFVRAHRLGEVILSPADIEFDGRTLLQPDLLVAPLVEGRRPRSWREIRTLLLAVEVLSPSTARADRQVKRRRYQRNGVPEYWIVDLDARLVERWRPADERPEILAERLEWRASPEAPPLEIDLAECFSEILDE